MHDRYAPQTRRDPSQRDRDQQAAVEEAGRRYEMSMSAARDDMRTRDHGQALFDLPSAARYIDVDEYSLQAWCDADSPDGPEFHRDTVKRPVFKRDHLDAWKADRDRGQGGARLLSGQTPKNPIGIRSF